MDNENTNTTPDTEQTNAPESAPEQTETNSAEDIAKLRLELAKMKKACDKATHEASDYKKKWRATQSEQEQAAQEKAEKEAEREEQFNNLLRENTINKYEKNFLKLGYSADLANQAATAQYDNDTDELFKIQQTFISDRDKAQKSEWMKSMPTPPSGNDTDCSVTREQFNRMGYSQRVAFKQKYPETYKSYVK